MEYLKVKEAAKLLRISVAGAYALVAAKMLRHTRVGVSGGRILIPADAIDDYLKANTVGPEPDASAPAPRARSVTLKHLRLPS